jgi:signal transduction histidine kinase
MTTAADPASAAPQPGHALPWPLVRAQLLRGAGFVLLLCLAIALLLTATGRSRFGNALLHSLLIGLCCWLLIDGGRHLLSHLRLRARARRGLGADLPVGFPGWPGMALLLLVGMTLGPTAGSALARWLSGEPWQSPWTSLGGANHLTWLITLLASVASVVTLTLLERLSHARAEAEAARRAAAETQLKLLQSQLEPHMLFNTLANLRVLIGSDPKRAQAMLDRLIAFLRATLNASRSAMHPLATEFERLADYLALMQVRMGGRLQTQLTLPPDLQATAVPPLLLQPLVENSIKHGLEPKVGGGSIEVTARQDGALLLLQVRDSGIGLAHGAPAGGGQFGLQQVRERLRSLYGERATLMLQPAPGGGTLASIRLPLPPSLPP